jgi:hypothetical protein
MHVAPDGRHFLKMRVPVNEQNCVLHNWALPLLVSQNAYLGNFQPFCSLMKIPVFYTVRAFHKSITDLRACRHNADRRNPAQVASRDSSGAFLREYDGTIYVKSLEPPAAHFNPQSGPCCTVFFHPNRRCILLRVKFVFLVTTAESKSRLLRVDVSRFSLDSLDVRSFDMR